VSTQEDKKRFSPQITPITQILPIDVGGLPYAPASLSDDPAAADDLIAAVEN
jgi:hypothetical protein